MKKLLLCLLLLAGSVQAQTYTNLYSLWMMPWDNRIKYTITASLLDLSGKEVNKTALNSLFDNITVVFPLQVGSATVLKMRVVISSVGTNDKGIADLAVTATFDYTLSPAYLAVDGSNPTFVYTPRSFSPTLVASAPMPVVVPPPVIVPPPPPPTGTSPDGTKIPPATSITDSAGAIWTVGPKTAAGYIPFLRNGKQVGLGGVLCISSGNVWSVDGWQMWTATAGWTGVQATAPAGC